MNTSYYFQGKHFKSGDELPLSSVNRAFLYGDGFFETMRFTGKSIFNIEKHKNRIDQSSDLLGLEIQSEQFFDEVLDFLIGQFSGNPLRLRFTFFRAGAGKYTPENNAGAFLLSMEPMENELFALNENGLRLGEYTDQKKAKGKLANIKSLSAQLYVQALKFAKEGNMDDALIFNTEGNIIESCASNIFAIKSGYLFTPALSEGPVAGTMRALLLQNAAEIGLTASSGVLTKDALKNADEIWLTNAIQGIKWVEHFDGKNFQKKYADKAIEVLNQDQDL